MAKGFASCGGCGRHVRGGDSVCPFCNAAIVDAARPVFDAPGSRVSRAAMLAAGAAAAAAIVAGCSSSDPTPGPVTDAAVATDGPVVQPAYGAPVLSDASDQGDDSSTGIAQPAYGSPVSFDAGPGEGGIAQPVYGAPVSPVDGGR